MTTLLEAIKKSKLKNTKDGDIRQLVLAVVQDDLKKWLDSKEKEVSAIILDLKKNVKKGDKGDPGKDSKVPGPQGRPGRDGKDGKPGKDSTVPGPKGDPGKSIKGDPGKDGSPDTGDQIIEKVNRSDKKIKPERIEGLVEAITRVGSGGQSGGGGGMGKWEHEVFNISSATTTVTLARSVAAGGSAILVRYQGQLLAHGVQYTISGRIITLSFTPDDSTVLEITYVRT